MKRMFVVCERDDASDGMDVRGEKMVVQKQQIQLSSTSSDNIEGDRAARMTYEERFVSPNVKEAGYGEWVRRATTTPKKKKQIVGIERGKRYPHNGSRTIFQQIDTGSKILNSVNHKKGAWATVWARNLILF